MDAIVDPRITRALEAIRDPIDAFRATATLAADRVAGLQEASQGLDTDARTAMERAHAVLHAVADTTDDAFVLTVEPGRSFRQELIYTLSMLGRLFGASMVVELARTGAYDPGAHEDYLQCFPPAMWSRGERAIAPPLVVALPGSEFRAGAFVDLVDEGTRFIFVLSGESTPAPLARVITPRLFAQQTNDIAALETFAAAPSPAVLVLTDAHAARFTHDPRAGATLAERLTIGSVPSEAQRPLGARSVWQQREELALLASLAAAIPVRA